jgi:hypothetical protein
LLVTDPAYGLTDALVDQVRTLAALAAR